MEGYSQLFLTENRLKILRVNSGVVATSLFKVHIPTTSKCIGICTKLSRTEAHNEVELGKEFRPWLVAVQKLSRGKIFEIFVVDNNINGSCGTFEVVAPNVEHFVDSKELLVMDVIVEFGSGK